MRDDKAFACQFMQQAVGKIIQIMQALAQIRVRAACELGARIILHALDSGFSGQARADGLAQTTQPAAVMGKHAECFEHFAMLARARRIATVDQ